MTRYLFFVILIFFLGFSLRFWNVGVIPPGLNRDEASIGYTAYSILKTGKDEYGVSLPISFKSFGDWKLPFYIYADILPVAFFDLNEFTTRIPSVVFGLLTILTTYFLALELLREQTNKKIIPLTSAFFLSISSWHIHFSRVASEANISVFLVTLALLLFIKGLSVKILLLLSSLLLGLTLYTYHGSHIFTPILFLGLLFIAIKTIKDKWAIYLFLLPFIFLSILIYKETLFSADRTKISGLTPLGDRYLVFEKVTLLRLEHPEANNFISVAMHNKLTLLIEKFIEGYLRSFSTEFLFIKGGGNQQHNIPNFGNFYYFEVPLILIGLYSIFKYNFKYRWLLLFWLLISPIPAAITRDAPHSARMLSLLPLPQILVAVGVERLTHRIKERSNRIIVFSILTFFLIVNVSLYLDRYHTHFPLKSERVWGGGFKELAAKVSAVGQNYQQIVVDRPDYSPYIYFIFYNKENPSVFQKEALRYKEDREGFHHLESFKNLIFKKIDWSEDLLVPDRLIVSWAEETPKGATNSSALVDKFILSRLEQKFGRVFGLREGDTVINRLLDVIKLKNGQSQFYLIEVKKP